MPQKVSNKPPPNPNCVGENISPQLSWKNPPDGTRSYALTMVDPEGYGGMGVVHWVAYGIPATVTSFAEGEVSKPSSKYVGGKSTEEVGYYSGPCTPPGAPHQYVFRIIATDLAITAPVHLIAANFAVLNLVADLKKLFGQFAHLLAPGGFVLASLLNPFFLGDAKYSWWRANLGAVLKFGTYSVAGESGNIHRFAPAMVARAAQPDFRVVRVVPRGVRLATHRYMFMLFQRV